MTDKELNTLFLNLNFNVDQLKLSNETNNLYSDKLIKNSKIIKINENKNDDKKKKIFYLI